MASRRRAPVEIHHRDRADRAGSARGVFRRVEPAPPRPAPRGSSRVRLIPGERQLHGFVERVTCFSCDVRCSASRVSAASASATSRTPRRWSRGSARSSSSRTPAAPGRTRSTDRPGKGAADIRRDVPDAGAVLRTLPIFPLPLPYMADSPIVGKKLADCDPTSRWRRSSSPPPGGCRVVAGGGRSSVPAASRA